MAGMNVVNLIGRVGKDPEIMRFQNGDEVANFSLATSETWTDKRSGDKRERTEWHQIKVFGEGNIKVVRKYVNKGDQIGIEGAIQYRQWEKDGEKRYATEIVVGPFRGRLHLLGSRKDGGGDHDDDRGRNRDRDDRRRDDDRSRGGDSRRTQTERDLDDEIPF